jgi:hypothetical protein
MAKPSQFNQRVAVLATMHQKEAIIAPLLEPALGIQIQVPTGLDTDRFGTFTREIKRKGTQIEAARQKVTHALKLTGESLAIASEGSFFPDPILPFGVCDREIVLFYDRQHQLEVIGEVLSREVNHQGQTVSSLAEALDFAQKVGFPEQGLVVMLDANTPDGMVKGIRQLEDFKNTLQQFLARYPTAYLETDLRAMHNPKRREAIALATQDLIKKLQQYCPQCQLPGFDITETRLGLRCGLCSLPTSLVRAYLYQCQGCDYREERPTEVAVADPTYCPYCNP